MLDWFTEVRWSPYAAGIGIGILSWLTLLISREPLGCSTAFARAAGMLEQLLRGRKALRKPYYQEFTPALDWQGMLVIGIVLGAGVSSLLSGDFGWQWVPHRWGETFGDNPILRLGAAFVGGVLLGFGARWAGGCTSGHGISGTMQLAVSGWVSSIGFFAGGILMAAFLFGLMA